MRPALRAIYLRALSEVDLETIWDPRLLRDHRPEGDEVTRVQWSPPLTLNERLDQSHPRWAHLEQTRLR